MIYNLYTALCAPLQVKSPLSPYIWPSSPITTSHPFLLLTTILFLSGSLRGLPDYFPISSFVYTSLTSLLQVIFVKTSHILVNHCNITNHLNSGLEVSIMIYLLINPQLGQGLEGKASASSNVRGLRIESLE